MGQPLVELVDIRKRYGTGEAAFEALRGVSFSIDEGEFVAIMGASGSGKATAMNIIGARDSPTAGAYLFSGMHVESLSRDQRALLRRKYLGFVFQGFNLLARTTALENVELPLLYRGMGASERRKLARAALDRVGLLDWEHHTPAELSGGQQQRVAIARALAMDPEVLFFDEPTSALDPELTRDVLKVIRDLAAERMTMVIVTHEMTFARDVADRIIFMDDGLVVEEGRAVDVINNPQQERTRAFLSQYQQG